MLGQPLICPPLCHEKDATNLEVTILREELPSCGCNGMGLGMVLPKGMCNDFIYFDGQEW